MKSLILFRRLDRPPQVVDGVCIYRWETAVSESDLRRKLNGGMAEVHMPAKPWYVRLWRRFFPLKFVELPVFS